jgi:hypothetical protein
MFYARTLSLSIDLRDARASEFVMAGLDPAIHASSAYKQGVDARHKAGHVELWRCV